MLNLFLVLQSLILLTLGRELPWHPTALEIPHLGLLVSAACMVAVGMARQFGMDQNTCERAARYPFAGLLVFGVGQIGENLSWAPSFFGSFSTVASLIWPALAIRRQLSAKVDLGTPRILLLGFAQIVLCCFVPAPVEFGLGMFLQWFAFLAGVVSLALPGAKTPFGWFSTAALTLAGAVIFEEWLFPGCCVGGWIYTLAMEAALLSPLLILRSTTGGTSDADGPELLGLREC